MHRVASQQHQKIVLPLRKDTDGPSETSKTPVWTSVHPGTNLETVTSSDRRLGGAKARLGAVNSRRMLES